MSEVVRYELDGATEVLFEIEPANGFRPAGAAEIAGHVREAVEPAVRAARAVLEQLKNTSPDEVEVKFGIKVSGKANWMIAKASSDANFEVRMLWRSDASEARIPADKPEDE